jgi:hypothetical protein
MRLMQAEEGSAMTTTRTLAADRNADIFIRPGFI